MLVLLAALVPASGFALGVQERVRVAVSVASLLNRERAGWRDPAPAARSRQRSYGVRAPRNVAREAKRRFRVVRRSCEFREAQKQRPKQRRSASRSRGGGLWVGKHYGAGGERYGDPLADHPHAATVRQLRRFYLLLSQEKLVSREASRVMLDLFASPDMSSCHAKRERWRSESSAARRPREDDGPIIAGEALECGAAATPSS